MRKTIVLTLLVALAGGTGLWASGDTDTQGAAGELVVIEGFFRLPPTEFNWEGTWMQQAIRDRFGIDLQVTSIGNEAMREREKIVLLSGDMPDFIGGYTITATEVNQLGQNGILYPVDTLFDQMPNFQKRVANMPAIELDRLRAPDGHIYTLPGGFDKPSIPQRGGPGVRTDLLDDVGFDWQSVQVCCTTDTFDHHLEMYRAMKAAYGPHPIASRKGLGGLLGNFTMIPMGHVPPNRAAYWGTDYKEDSDRFEFTFTNPDVKFALQWLRTMWDEQILHPDILTMSEDEYEPIQQSEARWPVVCCDSYPWYLSFPDRIKQKDPSFDQEWAQIKPPSWEGEQKPFRTGGANQGGFGFGGHVLVNADMDPDRLEKLIEFVDFWHTQEAADWAWYGEPDVDWTYVPDPDPSTSVVPGESNGMMPVFLFEGVPGLEYEWPANFEFPRPLRGPDEWEMRGATRVYLKPFAYMARAGYGGKNQGRPDPYAAAYLEVMEPIFTRPNMPVLEFGEHQDEILRLGPALLTVVEETTSKIIAGFLEVDAGWDQLQSQLDRVGVDRWNALINQVYQVYQEGM